MENWIVESDMSQIAIFDSGPGWMQTQLFYDWFKTVFCQTLDKRDQCCWFTIDTSLIYLNKINPYGHRKSR